MNKVILSSLILVLLVAGCVNPLDSLFNQGGSTQVKELPPDVLSIQNITVLPSTSVRERDQFSVFFDLMNQDELNETLYSYNIYDTGLCDWTGGDSRSGSDSLFPQEIRQIEWNFNAPSSQEIANLRVTCPIRFRFDFDYQAKSQIDVLVMNSERLRELQRAGKSTTFSPTLNVGRGPIKIYFDFGTTLPVRNNSELTVYVRVEDKGTGMLENIESDSFTIRFPKGFNVIEGNGATCPSFNCELDILSAIEGEGWKCTNYQNISIISKKTLDIRCSGITTPSVVDEKTYFISATLDYGYYVAGQVDVEVKPE